LSSSTWCNSERGNIRRNWFECFCFKEFTFDASPSFTDIGAVTSPLVFATPNTVRITLNNSVPFPVSACGRLIIGIL
jgi:hypothetical protein